MRHIPHRVYVFSNYSFLWVRALKDRMALVLFHKLKAIYYSCDLNALSTLVFQPHYGVQGNLDAELGRHLVLEVTRIAAKVVAQIGNSGRGDFRENLKII